MKRLWRLTPSEGPQRLWEAKSGALDAYLERPLEAPRIFRLHWRLRGRPGTPWVPYSPGRDDMKGHMARHPGRLIAALAEDADE
jgi:hypothetical protein